MIKALAHDDQGRPVIILGLSRKNTEELLKDRPIPVDLTMFGIEGGGRILIIAGETEEAMAAQLDTIKP